MRHLLICSIAFLALSCTGDPSRLVEDAAPLQSIDRKVNLERYAGLWYEIARFPAFFQKGCRNTTAEYKLREDGKINVTNRCDLENDEKSVAHGTARVVEPETNAKLKVRFEGFPSNLFEGDYWIIKLDPSYSWAVVSEPKGRYLWILSRTKSMDPQLYDEILQDLKSRGFQTDKLIKS